MRAHGIPRLSIAVLLMAGAGCSSPSAPPPVTEPPPRSPQGPAPPTPEAVPSPTAWQAAHALTVEEAAYRYQFVEYRSEPQIGPLTYCLARTPNDDPFAASVWTDPPPELMLRFRDHRPPVKRLAVCHRDVFAGVTDIETGGRAVIFRVAPPVWESDTEVLVDGGYYFNGISASGKTYRVRFQGGEWIVVDAQWRWIS